MTSVTPAIHGVKLYFLQNLKDGRAEMNIIMPAWALQ